MFPVLMALAVALWPGYGVFLADCCCVWQTLAPDLSLTWKLHRQPQAGGMGGGGGGYHVT